MKITWNKKEQGQRLNEAVKSSGKSVATICTEAGVSGERVLSRYIEGSYTPGEEVLKKLSKALGVTVDWILTGQQAQVSQGQQAVLKPDTKKIGEELKRARKNAGLSVNGVAEALATSRTSIYTYESGKTTILPDRLEALAELYGVKLEDLVTKEELAVLQRYAEEKKVDIDRNRRVGNARKGTKFTKKRPAKAEKPAETEKPAKVEKPAETDVKPDAEETKPAQAKPMTQNTPNETTREGVSAETQMAAQNIRSVRVQKRFTIGETADKLGIDRSLYSELEAGRREITLAEIAALSKIFGVNADVLLDGVLTEKWHIFRSRKALELFGVAGVARVHGIQADESHVADGEVRLFATNAKLQRLFKCLGQLEGKLA